jgi:hypothetical protein
MGQLLNELEEILFPDQRKSKYEFAGDGRQKSEFAGDAPMNASRKLIRASANEAGNQSIR